MELECPACGGYDCHFDGLHFVCVDCGHTWGGYCPCTMCDD